MENVSSWIFWLFPAAFVIHNIEEAIWLPQFSKSAGKFHKPVNSFEFNFALFVLTLLSIIITFLFYFYGKESIAAYLYFAFNLGMLINVLYPHLIATIVLKKYCPGLFTGIILLVPVTTCILLSGYQLQYYSFPKFWMIFVPFAILVVGSIPLLFKVGIYVEHRIMKKNNVKQ